jgi:tRNA(fMet)-specific endonuclease VapC
MIMLDTDVCIELLKGNQRVLRQRDRYDGPVGVCFMTVAELYYGAEKSGEPGRNMDTIDRFLLTVEVVQSDLSILRRFGALKAELQKEGIPLADADVLIAAATLEKADLLVTGNRKHFDRIRGLRLEGWV